MLDGDVVDCDPFLTMEVVPMVVMDYQASLSCQNPRVVAARPILRPILRPNQLTSWPQQHLTCGFQEYRRARLP